MCHPEPRRRRRIPRPKPAHVHGGFLAVCAARNDTDYDVHDAPDRYHPAPPPPAPRRQLPQAEVFRRASAQEAEDAFVEYLKIDTSNPPGNETAGGSFCSSFWSKRGSRLGLVAPIPTGSPVCAPVVRPEREGARPAPHIDVVPAVAAEWTMPPFSGARSGGYIWGRGALDVKSLGVAELMAVIDLKRRKVRLKRDVIFLAVADEELGGIKGCKELLEQHPELFENVGFVLN